MFTLEESTEKMAHDTMKRVMACKVTESQTSSKILAQATVGNAIN